MSVPRAERTVRSGENYPVTRWPGAMLASREIWEISQQTRAIALDTRDSIFRIEDLLETLVAELRAISHPEEKPKAP